MNAQKIGRLSLSVNLGQKVMIGDNIFVTVMGIKPYQVKIGIEAPVDIPIMREKVYKRDVLNKVRELA